MSASKRLAGRRRQGVAIALLLALLPIRLAAGFEVQGAAQPTSRPEPVVLVTAGEHGTYSRVVFALGANRAYSTEPEPAGLRVVFPGAGVGFEYGGVYPERRAHRVVMAEPTADADGASFRLRFGCDCSARTFMLDDRLVVDVFDAASNGSESPSSRAAPTGSADAPAVSDRRAGGSRPGSATGPRRCRQPGAAPARVPAAGRRSEQRCARRTPRRRAGRRGLQSRPSGTHDRLGDRARPPDRGGGERGRGSPTGWSRRGASADGRRRGLGLDGAVGADRAAGSARCAGTGRTPEPSVAKQEPAVAPEPSVTKQEAGRRVRRDRRRARTTPRSTWRYWAAAGPLPPISPDDRTR